MDQAHSWILPQYSHSSWWKEASSIRRELNIRANPDLRNCSEDDMAKALQSVIFVDSLKYNMVGNGAGDTNTYFLVRRRGWKRG